MARYTKEQIEQVNNTDMVNFLAQEYGWKIVKVGNCYSTQEHDSIRIRPDRKLWFWNEKGIGGKGIFDWMEKIECQGFKPTMEKFIGKSFNTAEIYEAKMTEKKESNYQYFDGSAPAKFYDRQYKAATNYLTETRCISNNIVSELMNQGKIYQDRKYNVVFANLNDKGEVGFWCLRGTNSEKKFTRNMPGSNNPYYGFAVAGKSECDTIYVFEAPIDLLSHCTIAEIKYGKGSWHNQSRIALCGVNDTALKNYLSTHKNVHTIKFCLDNDDAGITATQNLMAKYYDLGYKTQSIKYKNCTGKDLNEMLCNYVNKTKNKSSTKASISEKKPLEKRTAEEKTKAPVQQKGSYNYDTISRGLY